MLGLYYLVHSTVLGDTVSVDPNGFADFTTIQAAIDDSGTVDGDIVIVRPGMYPGNVNLSGKAITLRSTNPTEPNIVLATIIYDVSDSAITCDSGEDPNTVIEGLSLLYSRGGMHNNNSSPTVAYCTFSYNSADYGAGMYNKNSSPAINHCTFKENYGPVGTGIYNDDSSPAISDCEFSYNSASYYGGGMYNENSSPVVRDCTFINNTASSWGGGMYNLDSSSVVIGCTFSGNSSTNDDGGGMYNYGSWSMVTIQQCGFCDNSPNHVYGPFLGTYSVSEACVFVTGDVDDDGDVDLDDFSLLAKNWLAGVE
jgi:hypothetical protein